jgi:hypothetical protein
MAKASRSYRLEKKGFCVEALCQRIGKDYLVSIWGGEAHIGAVGMAQPRASLKDHRRRSATASVFCYLGHKEDALVKEISELLASTLNTKVVVTAGLHWDHLDAQGIKQVVENVRDVVAQIISDERVDTPNE